MSSYTILPCAAIIADSSCAPAQPGLYAFLLGRDEALLPALAHHTAALEPLTLGASRVVYLGSTNDSLRRRLKHHVAVDSRASTFRRSLGLLLAEELKLEPEPTPKQRYFHFRGEGEARLTAWMCKHLNVAFRVCAGAETEERRLIQLEHPLLNIRHRQASPLARHLQEMRRRQSGLGRRPPELRPQR